MGLEERRSREKEVRRNAILKAARKLAFEKGFKSITVASIAKKAELSKGAVYLYFDSKEEIYVQILLKDIEKFHASLLDIYERGGTAGDMLRRFADVYIDFFLSDRELFRIFMTFMLHVGEMGFSEQLVSQLIGATNKTMEIIEKIFKLGIEKGEFPENFNIRQGQNAVWGLLNGVIALHLFTGKETTRERRIRTTARFGLDLFLSGLAIRNENEVSGTAAPGHSTQQVKE
ncbi:MAG: TetR/AcrR family transcriptional regulator [Syntrophobacterales bacterium]|nr:TetR/AcrR family transcriptional regulator [Syntrophobacterales bacterium]